MVAACIYDKRVAKPKQLQDVLCTSRISSEPVQRSAKIIQQSTISSFSTDVQQVSKSPCQNNFSALYVKRHQQYLPSSIQIKSSLPTDSLLNEPINFYESKPIEIDNVADSIETNNFCSHVCKEKANSTNSELQYPYSKLEKPFLTPLKRSDGSAEWRIRFAAVKRESYQQAAVLIGMGVFLFSVGVMLSVLHFAGYIRAQIAGPILLACGLLTVVCSIVWISIIKGNLKRREEVLTRTFSF